MSHFRLIICAQKNVAGDIIIHAQRIMGNDIIILPPHEFDNSSHWY
jgi:hypothetical protein